MLAAITPHAITSFRTYSVSPSNLRASLGHPAAHCDGVSLLSVRDSVKRRACVALAARGNDVSRRRDVVGELASAGAGELATTTTALAGASSGPWSIAAASMLLSSK